VKLLPFPLIDHIKMNYLSSDHTLMVELHGTRLFQRKRKIQIIQLTIQFHHMELIKKLLQLRKVKLLLRSKLVINCKQLLKSQKVSKKITLSQTLVLIMILLPSITTSITQKKLLDTKLMLNLSPLFQSTQWTMMFHTKTSEETRI